MKIEINVTGIDWSKLIEAVKVSSTSKETAQPDANPPAKKKVSRKSKPKAETKPSIAEDFMNMPLTADEEKEKPSRTTAEIVGEFTKNLSQRINDGKMTEPAVREAVKKVQTSEAFRHLGGIMMREMEPHDAEKFVTEVHKLLG